MCLKGTVSLCDTVFDQEGRKEFVNKGKGADLFRRQAIMHN